MREEIKASSVAAYIKKLFNLKDDVRDGLSDDEIIALDYFECICFLYKGKEKPIVTGFRQGFTRELETNVGLIELENIPHSKQHLYNNVLELDVLIGENGYDDPYLIELINKYLDEHWDK